ncbi:MAG: helix-turn-helix domain-containing protein, partial [Pseudomonadota bacterium]
PRRQLTQAGADILARQPWRGNVRELRNFIYRLALLARDEVIDSATIEPLLAQGEIAASARPIETDDRAQDMATAVANWLSVNEPQSGEVYDAALAAFERPLFRAILSQTGGNQLRAAQILGINRNTLRKRLADLGILSETTANRD